MSRFLVNEDSSVRFWADVPDDQRVPLMTLLQELTVSHLPDDKEWIHREIELLVTQECQAAMTVYGYDRFLPCNQRVRLGSAVCHRHGGPWADLLPSERGPVFVSRRSKPRPPTYERKKRSKRKKPELSPKESLTLLRESFQRNFSKRTVPISGAIDRVITRIDNDPIAPPDDAPYPRVGVTTFSDALMEMDSMEFRSTFHAWSSPKQLARRIVRLTDPDYIARLRSNHL